jgi:glyoxylase-like metal-dependent hydrolase (beta-lactamase superfamily II)
MLATSQAQTPAGQAGTRPSAAPDETPEYTVTATKVSGNFYRLEPNRGSIVGALVGPDGIFLVDSQEGMTTDQIMAALRKISDAPIRFLVNTHVHADHVGGNAYFAKAGAVIMTHENLRTRHAQHNISGGGAVVWNPPAPPPALAMVTYRGPITVHMNGEEIRLMPMPSAHTDGDTMVHFPAADVVMTGDFFRASGFPNIDRNNGGTLNGTLAALDTAIAISGPNTKIVPGHGGVTTRAALSTIRNMMIGVRDRVAQLIHQGKTPDEVVATKPTSDFDQFVPGGSPATADRFVRQVYSELVAGQAR